MELIDYLRMLRRQWLWVVGSVVVLTALAAAYVSVAPKTYRATTDLYVVGSVLGDPQNQNDAVQSASKYVFDNIDTFAALVDSPQVTGPVITKLSLATTPEQLAKHVTATVVPSTAIITVAATDASPDGAAAIANATATSLSATIKDLALPSNQSPLDIHAVKPATAPTTPDSPNRTLWLALGVLLGLALGLVIATLREQSRRTPKSAAAMATAQIVDDPAADDVVAREVASVGDEPSAGKPSSDGPSADGPSADGPSVDRSSADKSSADKSNADKSNADKSNADKQSAGSRDREEGSVDVAARLAGSSARPAPGRPGTESTVRVPSDEQPRTGDPVRARDANGARPTTSSTDAEPEQPTDPEGAPRNPAQTRR